MLGNLKKPTASLDLHSQQQHNLVIRHVVTLNKYYVQIKCFDSTIVSQSNYGQISSTKLSFLSYYKLICSFLIKYADI